MNKPYGSLGSQQSIMHALKSGKPITDIIQKSQAQNEATSSKNLQEMWFHGRLTRGNAVHNLKKAGAEQGKFLVRESINIRGCFVLSIMNNGTVQHFQINTSRHSGCFNIDNGPQFVGLDQLISFYRTGANGLPTKLLSACSPGNSLPPSLRQFGEYTIVHQAVAEGLDAATFRKILDNPSCPSLNTRELDPKSILDTDGGQTQDGPFLPFGIAWRLATSQDISQPNVFRFVGPKNLFITARELKMLRNMKGKTALQEASRQGLNDMVIELVKHGADVSTRDCEGNSALHLACRNNQPDTCKILVKHCKARAQDRCCGSGWVPLHEAAYYGHHACLEVLLHFGAACYSRSVNDETPLDLARKRNQRNCIRILEQHKPAKPILTTTEFLHTTLDRHKAVEILEHSGLRDGYFLVRVSKRNPGQHVLTMSFDKSVFNYEIKNRSVDNVKRYFIDDGPYFISLEYLIDYYSHAADGLPAQLTSPTSPTSRNWSSGDINGQQKMVNDRPPLRLPPPMNRPTLPHKPQLPPLGGGFPPPRGGIPSVPVKLKEIKREDVALGRELGQGEFGSVLMGVWTNPEGSKTPVALKTLHGDHITEGETEFKREAEVMMSLDHQCIVKLYGICRGESLMMVQELVSMGSALDYILDYPSMVHLQDFKLWAAQIASGMNYLEGKGFVHRDLALRNILLAAKQLVKISDFGLSRAVGAGSDYYKASAGGRWPVKWYAPESINYGTFSSSSDVWSYGVTLWEIFSRGEQPYENMTGAQVMQYLEDDRRRLQKPNHCPDKVYSIMLQCWAYEAKERPTFRRLHSKFRQDPDYFNIQVPGHD